MNPNVLVVVLDSVRARNLGLYGHVHETTPYLQTLAESSVVYESAWSPTIWTLPSHASMFSGYEVEQHRVTSTDARLDPEASVFSELSREGYETGVFSENTWLTEADVGLKDGFDTVVGKPGVLYPDALNPGEFAHRNEYGAYREYVREALGHENPIQSLLNGVATKIQYDFPDFLSERLLTNAPGEYYVSRMLEWVKELPSGQPWAACINLMDAHRPYRPDDQFDRWSDSYCWDLQESIEDPVWSFLEGDRPLWQLQVLEGLYDGGIRQCDAAIEKLMTTLEKRGALDDTYVIVTADHGEGFGERSNVRPGKPAVEHKQGIHPVQTHVPLIVRPPDGTPDIVDGPVTLTKTADAIRSMTDGSFNPKTYRPESGVAKISYTEAKAQQIDSSASGDVVARSIVTGGEEGIEKFSIWEEETAAVVVPGAQRDCLIEDSEARDRIDAAFEGIESVEVNEDREGEMGEATLQHLEELGYR